jgi:hypothetical protein
VVARLRTLYPPSGDPKGKASHKQAKFAAGGVSEATYYRALKAIRGPQ